MKTWLIILGVLNVVQTVLLVSVWLKVYSLKSEIKKLSADLKENISNLGKVVTLLKIYREEKQQGNDNDDTIGLN